MLALKINKKTKDDISVIMESYEINLEKEYNKFNIEYVFSSSPMLSLENNIPPTFKDKQNKKKLYKRIDKLDI